MDNTIKRVNEVIASIQRLDDEDFSFEESLEEEELKMVEQKLGITLPIDFRIFSMRTNGCSFLGNNVVPLIDKDGTFKGWNIVSLNKREHEEVENVMPSYFLPFSPNGRGDHYCFDLRKKNPDGTYPVIFWQWDYSFYYPDDIEQVTNNFLDWIIEEIEEEYA